MHVIRTLLLFFATAASAQQAVIWTELPPLPVPVTNNAVASIVSHNRTLLFSMMGMGTGKSYDAITRDAYLFDSQSGQWSPIPHVPGAHGRIAAAAVGIAGHVFLFGGYTVDADGKEVSSSSVDIYTPAKGNPNKGYWAKGVNIPTAIDDSIAVAYGDRYIVLVSGWSQQDSVNTVQVYDTWRNTWRASTPIPGIPVFGHAGAATGRMIVYCGGAYKNPAQGPPRYLASEDCWQGKVKYWDGTQIEWKKLPPHPYFSQYRMAAAEWNHKIVFVGGTSNPYNYNGIGYNGEPSHPSKGVFAWDTHTELWEQLASHPHPTMDHRGLIRYQQGLAVIGGMEGDQKVSARVSLFTPAN